MKKGKICSKLKKMLITIMCVITLVFSMPVRAKAGIIGDFLDLLLRIPDAVMWLGNRYIVGTDATTSINLDFKGWSGKGKIYNFELTPYNIFTTGIDVGDRAKTTYNWVAKGNQYDDIAKTLKAEHAEIIQELNISDGSTVYEININTTPSFWDSYFANTISYGNVSDVYENRPCSRISEVRLIMIQLQV